MRVIILSILLLILSLSVQAQYDFYIKSLLKTPAVVPDTLPGDFVRKKKVSVPIYYEFSNPSFPINYYPPDQDCGYFELFGKQYLVKGKYSEWEKFGCDLDGETFEIFHLKVRDRNYFIVTSIAISNGKGTRDVFCQLFDITDKKNIIYYPLWSIYGSHLSFGDYNGDGKLDFLETRYERDAKKDDTFKLKLKTLNKDQKAFEDVKGKYIVFQRDYIDNSPKITIIEKHW